ncbi:BnaC06g42480D [Brassica napus]|uniref:BnaC06g42480D protein n=1 Tax=Brassica napus TaxID=3708 RepID=A0A078IKM0_BRANA|nr:BnaC06g42480D [Brassica napus]
MTLSFVGLSFSAPFVASVRPLHCGGVVGRYGDSFSGDAEQGEEVPLFLVEIVSEYNVYEHMVITKIKDGVNVAASHTLISGGLTFGVGVFALKSVLKFRCGGKVSKL